MIVAERHRRFLRVARATGRIWTVESESTAGLVYVVRFDECGWTCTCPWFQHRRMNCKHIHAVWLKSGKHDG